MAFPRAHLPTFGFREPPKPQSKIRKATGDGKLHVSHPFVFHEANPRFRKTMRFEKRPSAQWKHQRRAGIAVVGLSQCARSQFLILRMILRRSRVGLEVRRRWMMWCLAVKLFTSGKSGKSPVGPPGGFFWPKGATGRTLAKTCPRSCARVPASP